VPEAALREAVLNAIVHKDYGSGTPIQISVYRDKLMLWNPGELPPDWTMAKLRGKHPSRPFNPDVANAFFRAGMIEAWGRGIERIIQACRAAVTPTPQFRHEQTGLWVKFRFPEGFTVGGTAGTTQDTTQETTQEKVLALLRAEPGITRRALAARIGITPDGIKYHLERLRSARAIRRLGPTKSGTWEVLR
jgi:ATP-dependent DNA helicase RecG